jgi:hypothetical protein
MYFKFVKILVSTSEKISQFRCISSFLFAQLSVFLHVLLNNFLSRIGITMAIKEVHGVRTIFFFSFSFFFFLFFFYDEEIIVTSDPEKNYGIDNASSLDQLILTTFSIFYTLI